MYLSQTASTLSNNFLTKATNLKKRWKNFVPPTSMRNWGKNFARKKSSLLIVQNSRFRPSSDSFPVRIHSSKSCESQGMVRVIVMPKLEQAVVLIAVRLKVITVTKFVIHTSNTPWCDSFQLLKTNYSFLQPQVFLSKSHVCLCKPIVNILCNHTSDRFSFRGFVFVPKIRVREINEILILWFWREKMIYGIDWKCVVKLSGGLSSTIVSILLIPQRKKCYRHRSTLVEARLPCMSPRRFCKCQRKCSQIPDQKSSRWWREWMNISKLYPDSTQRHKIFANKNMKMILIPQVKGNLVIGILGPMVNVTVQVEH